MHFRLFFHVTNRYVIYRFDEFSNKKFRRKKKKKEGRKRRIISLLVISQNITLDHRDNPMLPTYDSNSLVPRIEQFFPNALAISPIPFHLESFFHTVWPRRAIINGP